MEELGAGVYRWTTPHPEYRTTREEVASYALTADEGLALVDPLVATGTRGAALLARLDELARAAPRVDILITIPYHTRSAEALWRRWHGETQTHIWGHRAVAKRFIDQVTPLDRIEVTAPLGPLARALHIGKPRRWETPLYFAAARALAFGDAVVGMPDGSLRVWVQGQVDPTWYEERFLPTLRPLAALELDRVLVTHGPPVLKGGRRALTEGLESPPVLQYW